MNRRLVFCRFLVVARAREIWKGKEIYYLYMNLHFLATARNGENEMFIGLGANMHVVVFR